MEHIDSANGVILFTDIKDFTLKTSLLTQKQINSILDKQEEIVFPILDKYSGKLVKSIGDAYMVVFYDAKNAINASIEIQKELIKYNKDIKLNLYKIEIRMSLDYGLLNRKGSIVGDDFFGDAVNVAARLQSKTDENKIYITGKVREKLNEDDFILYDLGKITFKGVLYELNVYEVIYNEIDLKLHKLGDLVRDKIVKINLKKTEIDTIKEIDDLIFKVSSVAALVSIQPIPFLDIYSVLPLHLYLFNEIAKKHGIKLSLKESKLILATIASSAGSSYMIGQGILGISKIGLIGIAGYLAIPFNFALTYSIGKVISLYFYYESKGLKAKNKDLKEMFNYSKVIGKEIGKKEKTKIIKTGKKYKDKIMNSVKKQYMKIKKKT